MEKESKRQECLRCKYFNKYYTLGTNKFIATKIGWCSLKLKHMCIHENCEFYALKGNNRILKRAIKLRLNTLMTEMINICKVIQEESGNNE